MNNGFYIKVILPLKLEWEPWYRVPEGQVSVGCRVRVRCARKEYVGVVAETDVEPDIEKTRIQDIISVEEGLERISEEEIKLWKFVSKYYLCSIGEVYKAAYPQAKLTAETKKARVKKQSPKDDSLTILSLDQQQDEAYNTILQSQKPCLLKASVKDRNEIYAALCRHCLNQSKDVLVLVPDIKLGKTLYEKLSAIFGEKVLRFSSSETIVSRRNTASALRGQGHPSLNGDKGPFIVVGTRSSIFLPFSNLGLIIIDQEQDSFYKQDSPAPRYNCRDVAVVLGNIHSAKILLGSLTPSFESLNNCNSGRYSYAEVPVNISLEKVQVIDTSAEYKKKGMRNTLSIKLIQLIDKALKADQKSKVKLYCSSWDIENLKEDLNKEFPESPGIEVEDYSGLRTASLTGVSLVGLIALDKFLPRSLFRSDERSLQLLLQVEDKLTKTQKSSTRLAVQVDGGALATLCADSQAQQMLIAERKNFAYPPFTRFVDVVFKDTNPKRSAYMISELSKLLKDRFELMGANNDAIRIVLPNDKSLAQRKSELLKEVETFEKERKYKTFIHLDVDPD